MSADLFIGGVRMYPNYSHSIVQMWIKLLILHVNMAFAHTKTDYWLVKMLRF